MWHVSVARINSTGTALVPVELWPPFTRKQASELQNRILQGVGGDWQLDEIGIEAAHRRRRLNPAEIRLLHGINAACPVFTHGSAMQVVGSSTAV